MKKIMMMAAAVAMTAMTMVSCRWLMTLVWLNLQV